MGRMRGADLIISIRPTGQFQKQGVSQNHSTAGSIFELHTGVSKNRRLEGGLDCNDRLWQLAWYAIFKYVVRGQFLFCVLAGRGIGNSCFDLHREVHRSGEEAETMGLFVQGEGAGAIFAR